MALISTFNACFIFLSFRQGTRLKLLSPHILVQITVSGYLIGVCKGSFSKSKRAPARTCFRKVFCSHSGFGKSRMLPIKREPRDVSPSSCPTWRELEIWLCLDKTQFFFIQSLFCCFKCSLVYSFVDPFFRDRYICLVCSSLVKCF